MSEAAEDQGWQRVEPAAPAGRYCELCEAWCDHLTDSHEADDLPSREFVARILAEARKKLGRPQGVADMRIGADQQIP